MLTRAIGSVLAVGLSSATLYFAAGAASAGPAPVVVGDDVGGVDTTVVNPGAPGSGGTQPVGGSSSGRSGPTCTYTLVIGNAEEYAYEEPGMISGIDGNYYQRQCSDGTSIVYWQPIGTAVPGPVLPTPGELAQRAVNRLQLPKPQVGFSPDPATHPYQLVNLPTWWWTTNWAPLQQRTAAGPVFAEVTATPVQSTFDGGDGSEPAACDRAGLVWRSGLAEDDPRACLFTYRHSATDITSTVSTTWRVTWVGSGGSGGRLPDITTSSTQPLTVYERQTVNTYGRG